MYYFITFHLNEIIIDNSMTLQLNLIKTTKMKETVFTLIAHGNLPEVFRCNFALLRKLHSLPCHIFMRNPI